MVVHLENIWKQYGPFDALQGLSFSVPEGSVFALFGANGAGKTTTIKVLMNLIEPTMGDATLLGVNTRALSPKELACFLRGRVGWERFLSRRGWSISSAIYK